MFTGIIEEIGKVKNIRKMGARAAIEIAASKVHEDVNISDSIALNGACLTITKKNKNTLTFDVMGETLSKTNLKNLKINSSVNLERSRKASDRLDGHFVLGHVDGMRRILSFVKKEESSYIDIELKKEDHKYVVQKGSIAIDGISLTVGDIESDRIRIYLIPHTLKSTILIDKKPGDYVNVEFDILGKYVNKSRPASAITASFLKSSGF